MGDIEKILVFGANTTVGLEILKKGIEEGLQVSAFVEKGTKFDDDVTKDLDHIIEGDVFNQETVEEAIEGQHAIMCALQPTNWGGDKQLLSRGCQNIVEGMRKHKVTRLVVANTALALPGRRGCIHRLRLKFGANSDYIRVVKFFEEECTDLDWVIMMPPKIKNNPKVNPDYKVERNKVPGVWSITSGELADFMVKLFMDKTSTECFRHNKLGISTYTPKPRLKRRNSLIAAVFVVVLGVTIYMGYLPLPIVLQDFIDNVRGARDMIN